MQSLLNFPDRLLDAEGSPEPLCRLEHLGLIGAGRRLFHRLANHGAELRLRQPVFHQEAARFPPEVPDAIQEAFTEGGGSLIVVSS